MSKALFLIIVDDISNEFDWFKEGVDAKGQRSFKTIQKCTSALRQLAYGNVVDNYEEGLAMSVRTSRECLEYFCNAIIKLYGEEFLRSPTSHNIARLYEAHESKHHFPGMISCIDCTHWVWRNCPFSLRGQYHRVITNIRQSSLKQWRHKIYGFGMHILVLQVRAIISMLSCNHHCLLLKCMVVLLIVASRSMVDTTKEDTI